MRKKLMRSMALLILAAIALSAVVLAVTLQQQDSAKSSKVKQKTLKDIAAERDVEVTGASESHSEYTTLEDLTKDAVAIVYGRIIDSKSFFDESSPSEYGDSITTEYEVDVYRVLRETKLRGELGPGQPPPAPLVTPLKIARNGGTVNVNGHSVSVKVKGYESLIPGKQYVFFLFWSPDYKAYILAGGASGAVMVNDDQSLRPLASSKAIQEKFRGLELENFLNQLESHR